MAYHTMQIANQSSGREERMIMLIIIFISQHKTFTQTQAHMEFQLIEWFQVWLVKIARTYSVFFYIFIELHCPAALISSIYKKWNDDYGFIFSSHLLKCPCVRTRGETICIVWILKAQGSLFWKNPSSVRCVFLILLYRVWCLGTP